MMNDAKRRSPYQSPLRLLLILGSSIFTIELLIMLLVFFLPPLSMWVEALFDSILLVVLIFPILYYFAFRPMTLRIAERDRMEAELRQAHEELEARIQDRTAELERINKELHTEVIEHKETEDRLREAEVRYRTLFEQAPFGVVLIDPATTLPVEFNDKAHRQLGYSRDEFSQMRIGDYEAAEKPAETERHSHVVLRDGEDDFETHHRTKTGGICNIHVTVNTIFLSERPYLHCIFRDITDYRQAETALQQANAKLADWVSELEQRNREITLLSEMVNLFQACRTADEAYGIIARYTRQLFPADSGVLYVLNASRNLAVSVASWGKTIIGEQAFEPDECWALRRGKIHLIEQPDSAMSCSHLQQVLITTCLCVPMMAQGEALGILTLCKCSGEVGANETTETVNGFTAPEQQLAATAAEYFGLALANLKLRETLRRQSVRDPLTGLFNRRYLDETLDREMRRAERMNSSLGVMMLDIDHFKQFNDMFGHAAGDALLQALGNFLGRQVRGGDIACRYGGEEFTLILPDTSLEVIRQRAEMLRSEIKHLHPIHSGKSLGSVALSIGVALFPLHGATSEALLHVADVALYQAKRTGRDRVVVAETNQQIQESLPDQQQ